MDQILPIKFSAGIVLLFMCHLSCAQMDFDWVTHLPNAQASGDNITIKATCLDNNDNTFVVGQFKGAADFDPSPGSTILTSTGLEDIFIAKYSPLGDLLLVHKIGGYGQDLCAGIELDSTGNIYISGSISGVVDFDLGNGIYNVQNPGDAGVFIAKYDPSLLHIWTISLGSAALYEQIVDMDVDQNGEVFIVGNFGDSIDLDPLVGNEFWLYENGVSYSIFIAKYDVNGNFVWGDQIKANYPNARDIELDHAGSVLVTGDFYDSICFSNAVNTYYPSQAFRDVFIVKYANNGSIEWSNILNGSGFSEGFGIAIDNSNNILATGNFSGTINLSAGAIPDLHVSNGGEDVYLGKYAPNGTLLVGKHFGGISNDNGLELACDGLNNIYLAGTIQNSVTVNSTTLTSNGAEDVFLFRMDSLAAITSAKSFGGNYNDAVVDLEVNSSNQLRIAGSFNGTVDFDLTTGVSSLSTPAINSPTNAFLVQYDFLDDLDWAAQLGAIGQTNYPDEGSAIALDDQGNTYVAGSFTNSLDLDGNGPLPPIYSNGQLAYSSMGFLAKTDPNGNVLWSIPFLSDINSTAASIAIDENGNILVTGLFRGTVDFDPSPASASKTAIANDMFVAKYDENGTYIWSKNVGATSAIVESKSIVSDLFGNVFITGRFANGANPVDFDPGTGVYLLDVGTYSHTFLLKLNPNGLFLFAKEYGSGTSYGNCLTVDANNNIYLGGYFYGNINFSSVSSTAFNSYQNSQDGYFAKLDNNGNHILSKRIWGPDSESINSIGVDSEGRISVTGIFTNSIGFDDLGLQQETSAGSIDAFLAQYEPNGEYRWAFRLGASGDDRALSLAIDGNDNVYTSGYYTSSFFPDPSNTAIILPNSGSYGGFISKYNSLGEYISVVSVNGVGTDQILSIAVNGNDVCASGHFSSSVDFDNSQNYSYLAASSARDIFVSKYSQTCNNYSSNYQVSSCDSYLDTLSGNTYTTSGQYYSDYTSILGCDSSVQLNLIIHPQDTTYLNELSCLSYTLPGTGVVYTTSGLYTIDLQSNEGCDSTVILDLIIGESLEQTVVVEECGSFTWDFNNQTYNASGIYSSSIINQYGCDSTFTLDLTLLPQPNINVTQTQTGLSAPTGATSYLWLDCNANYAVIFGENQASFTPSYNGSFAVAVSNQDCTDTSTCFQFNSANLSENNFDFSIYPNPTNGIVRIELPNSENTINVKLMDARARIIHETEFNAVQQVELFIEGEPGIYFLDIEVNGTRFIQKIIKLNS